MKENPENKNSGFFLTKIAFITFENEDRFQFIFDKPKEVSEQLTSFGSIIFVVGKSPIDIMEPILCRKKVP